MDKISNQIEGMLEYFIDGDKVCVKQYGLNLQEGYAGFGDTLRDALIDLANSGI